MQRPAVCIALLLGADSEVSVLSTAVSEYHGCGFESFLTLFSGVTCSRVVWHYTISSQNFYFSLFCFSLKLPKLDFFFFFLSAAVSQPGSLSRLPNTEPSNSQYTGLPLPSFLALLSGLSCFI